MREEGGRGEWEKRRRGDWESGRKLEFVNDECSIINFQVGMGGGAGDGEMWRGGEWESGRESNFERRTSNFERGRRGRIEFKMMDF